MDDGLEPGSEFAGHLIDAEIGRGGMGVVYRARHLALDRVRALKVLAPELSADEDYVARFRRESRLAASVEHPNLVTVHHAGEESGRLYMSMKFIDGVDLGRLLADGALPTDRAMRILADVAGALDAAHAQGLIHRDVKPENILLGGDLDSERAYLTDFGIGTLADASDRRATKLTTRGVVLGSTDYIAPEQIRDEDLDGRADIYSLACVAFHMLTGSPPFAGETHLAVLAAHGSAPRPRASLAGVGVPPAVDGVLSSAMAIDPDDRPASASALVGQLRAAAGAPDRSGAATRPVAEVPARRERSRRRGAWGLILLAAVVVAAVAAGVVLLSGSSDEGSDTGSDPVVTATIPVPRGPVSVAAGADLVWVASRNADRVTAYGPDGSTPLGRGFDVEDPRELALGFGYLWAAGRDGLFRIDLSGTDIDRVLDLGDPSDLTVDDDRVWVLDRSGQPQALRFDPDTLKVDGAAFVGPDPRAIAAGAGAIWVANTGDGTVSEIDPETAETLHSPVEVGGRPTDIAAGGEGVWAVDNFGGKLVPIDPAPPSGTPVAGEAVATGPRPRAVAVGFGSIWVAVGESGELQRFSLSTSPELEGSTGVGDDPADIDVGGGSIWTADEGGDTVTKLEPGTSGDRTG